MLQLPVIHIMLNFPCSTLSLIQWNLIYINLDCPIFIISWGNPLSVVLSVNIGVGGWGLFRCYSVCLNGKDNIELRINYRYSSSDEYYIMSFIIVEFTKKIPFYHHILLFYFPNKQLDLLLSFLHQYLGINHHCLSSVSCNFYCIWPLN